jgi:hypothetical protein
MAYWLLLRKSGLEQVIDFLVMTIAAVSLMILLLEGLILVPGRLWHASLVLFSS